MFDIVVTWKDGTVEGESVHSYKFYPANYGKVECMSYLVINRGINLVSPTDAVNVRYISINGVQKLNSREYDSDAHKQIDIEEQISRNEN